MSDLSTQLREAADQCEGLDEEPTQRLLLDAAARVEEMDVAYGQAVKDLQTNAAMLARQCDLAREAESKAQGYAVAIRDLTSTLARVERERDEARATITDMQRRLDEDHFTIACLTGEQGAVTSAMDNVMAMRLGEIARECGGDRSDVGDALDRGLILARRLREEGFHLRSTDAR